MRALKLYDLLELAIHTARQRVGKSISYNLAAVGSRSDGLIVTAYNVTTAEGPTKVGHAEYRLSSKLTRGSVVAVARVSACGVPAMARPCRSCQTILRNYHVSRVIYTIAGNEYGIMEL